VTFAPDYGGNWGVLDLDPAGSGTFGQVLKFGRGVWGPIVYVAPSVRHLMRSVVVSMRGAAPDDEEWNAGEWGTPEYQWSIDIGDGSLPTEVAAVSDPSTIQHVHLRQVDRVHLADLARFPRLRSIRMIDVRRKTGYVNLSIPPGLPVEHVDIVAERFEPYRLAATPTIAYVTLAGNSEPVRVGGLAQLPNLVRLDLAAAAVADITSIAAFPALRVLSLNARQWDELLGTGWTPDRLAAAEIGGRASVAEAAAWLAVLRTERDPVVRHHTVRGPR
jgi:hypothetical protein